MALLIFLFSWLALQTTTAIPLNGYGVGNVVPQSTEGPPPPTQGSYLRCTDGSAALQGFNGQAKECTSGYGYASCPYGYECIVAASGTTGMCCSRGGSTSAGPTPGGPSETTTTSETASPSASTESSPPPSETTPMIATESLPTESPASTPGSTDGTLEPESPPPPTTASIPGDSVTTTAVPIETEAPSVPPQNSTAEVGNTTSSEIAETTTEATSPGPSAFTTTVVPSPETPSAPSESTSAPPSEPLTPVENPPVGGGYGQQAGSTQPPAATDGGNNSSATLPNKVPGGNSMLSIDSAVKSPSNPSGSIRKSSGPSVATSGQFTPCSTNADCFPLREPPEWCQRVNDPFIWTDKSCFCASEDDKPSCIIERFDSMTKQTQWTYCSPKIGFKCAQ